MENKAEHNASMKVEALNKNSMRTEDPQDRLVTQRPKIDLDGTTGKNSSDRLVRPAHLGFAKSVTETNSKVQELKTYVKAINNPVYGNR